VSDLTVPKGPDELTLGWLSACLRDSGALGSGELAAFSTHGFGEGTGLLSGLCRVALEYDGDARSAPRSLIFKFPSAIEQTRELCGAFGFYLREHRFYTQTARHTPLTTPRIHLSRLEGPTDFVLVMEEVRGAPGDQATGATPEQLEVATRSLARHHAAFWGRASQGDQAWIASIYQDASSSRLRKLARRGLTAIHELSSASLTPAVRQLLEGFPDRIPDLLRAVARGPCTVLHGDYRIDNMFFAPTASGPDLTVLDWQLVCTGRGPFDLAYLVTQSAAPEVRRRLHDTLLRQYHEALMQNGVRDYGFDECQDDYRRSTLYCLNYPLIAAGTLDLSHQRGVDLASSMLERSLSAILDLDAGDVLSQL